MCDPLTITATALAVGSTAFSTVSTMSAKTYEARLADRNRQLENTAARDALERGRVESVNLQRQQSQLQGAQNAALAANGVDITFGSAAAARGDTVMINQEDRATQRENNMREVKGFEINASNYKAQASAARQARSGALVKGVFDVGSTVLGAVKQYKKDQKA